MHRLPLRRQSRQAGRRRFPVPRRFVCAQQVATTPSKRWRTKKAVARIRVAVRGPLYRAYRKPVRTALRKRSGGRRRSPLLDWRHHTSAPTTASVLTALIQKGAAIPYAPITAPLSAGPTARLTLMPALLADTAADKSDFGTSCGTTDCQAGATTAEPASIRNVRSSKFSGVTR